MQDTYLLLHEIVSALKEGETRALSRLPSKMKLSVAGITSTENASDDVLRHDENYDLSKRLTSEVASKENVEKNIKKRQQQPTFNNSRKSNHQIRLKKLKARKRKKLMK